MPDRGRRVLILGGAAAAVPALGQSAASRRVGWARGRNLATEGRGVFG